MKTKDDVKHEFDRVIVTVPLGVLKKHVIKFKPELPQDKLESIRKLGSGYLDKVVFLFEEAFWDKDKDWFNYLSDKPYEWT